MITQIKSRNKNKIPEQNIITLQIHPQTKAKIRPNHRPPFRSSPKLKASKEKDNPLETNSEVQNFQLSSLRRVNHTGSFFPFSTRKLERPRLSSYQLYKQEQKHSKIMYKERGGEWNFRFWSKRSEDKSRGESRNVIRSKSSVEYPKKVEDIKSRLVNTINNFKLMTISNTISNSPRSRSMYIKTNDGKRKMIDNKKYLQRLKFTIQSNSLSAIIDSKTEIKTIEPSVFTLSPRSKTNNLKKDENKGRFDTIKNRSEMKKKSRADFNVQVYRPWSGAKNDFGFDFPIFLNNNN